MPYTTPTPDDIKQDFPLFVGVGDAAIQRRIDRTSSWVDDSWLEGDYTYAKSLLTAHYLTIDGLGSGTDAEISALGLSGVARLRSGSLDVSFTDAASSGSGSEFDASSYGRRFYALLRRNKVGPLTTGGYDCIADQATDMPWAYRTGGWGL